MKYLMASGCLLVIALTGSAFAAPAGQLRIESDAGFRLAETRIIVRDHRKVSRSCRYGDRNCCDGSGYKPCFPPRR